MFVKRILVQPFLIHNVCNCRRLLGSRAADDLALVNRSREVVKSIQSAKNCKEAVSIVHAMCLEPEGADVYALAAALDYCGKRGKWKLALELRDHARKNCLPINHVGYHSLISACGRSGQVNEPQLTTMQCIVFIKFALSIPSFVFLFFSGVWRWSCSKSFG